MRKLKLKHLTSDLKHAQSSYQEVRKILTEHRKYDFPGRIKTNETLLLEQQEQKLEQQIDKLQKQIQYLKSKKTKEAA